MKILIAEDDYVSRLLVKKAVAKAGHETIVAENGKAAWEAYQKEGPHMVISDWMMPQMDGVELCRKLREQERKDPIYLILLTSRSDSRDLVQGLESGADDYIAKPYDNAELKARVNVGCRMLLLQNEMREREKLQGVLEMAGAVCHELNQPLQVVSGYSEMLLETEEDDRNYEALKSITQGIKRIGELTGRIMRITRYKAKPYLKGSIVDISQASE